MDEHNKKRKKLLKEIIRNILFATVATFIFYPELISTSFSLVEFLKKSALFMFTINIPMIVTYIPTFINLYVGESKEKKPEKAIYDGKSARHLSLKEKIEVAKELKESFTLSISWKQWLFIVASTSFTSWFFLRDKEDASGEYIFTSVFLGLFFSVVLVGLGKIIQDEKDKNSN